MIVFNMFGINVILGMEWLFRHFIGIDCRWRTVTFSMPRMEDMFFRGNKLRSMLEVITSLQAKKDLAHGAKTYLVHLVLKEKEPKEIEDIPMVREFSKVFRELLGLPPFREINFSIETETSSSIKQDTLPNGANRVERAKWSTRRVVEKKIYQAKHFTLESTSTIREKER